MSDPARAILDAKLALEAELARPLDQTCMAYIRARQANGNNHLGVWDRMEHAARLERVLLRHYSRVVMVMTGRRPRINPEPSEAALSLRHLDSMRARAKRQADLILTSIDRGFASEKPVPDPHPHDDGMSLYKSNVETKADDKPKPTGWIGKFRAKIPTIANVQTNGPAEEARLEVVPDDQANGKIVKVWHNVGDNRVRGAPHNPRPSAFDHWTPEGQERIVTDAFDVSGERLMYPGDSSLGASLGNVINCRCFTAYSFVGDDGTRTPIYTSPSSPARRQKRPNETLEQAKPRLNPTSQVTLNGTSRGTIVLHDAGKTIAEFRQLKPNLIEVRVNGRVIARAETNPEAGTVTKITVTPKYRSNGSDVEGIIRRSVAGSAEHLATVRARTP